MGRGATKPRRRIKKGSMGNNRETDLLPPDLSKLSRAETITLYHTLKKQLAAVDKNPLFPNEASREARRQVLRAQLKLVGIEKYQMASREGEVLGGGFDSSQWVTRTLLHGKHELFTRNRELLILDVGAITHRFPEQLEVDGNGSDSTEVNRQRNVPLHVTSIDLSPEDSEAGRRVIKADFFDFARMGLNEGDGGSQYDVICLSMCVNFEGSATRRGSMMYLAARLLNKGGLMFVVLPRACVENSRYFDEAAFRKIVEAIGMGIETLKYTPKLLQSVLKKVGHDELVHRKTWRLLSKKKLVREGRKRNNFAICLDEASLKEYERETQDQADAKPSTKSTLRASAQAPRDILVELRRRKKRKRTKKTGLEIEKPVNTSNKRRKMRRQNMRGDKDDGVRTSDSALGR